jgi:SAM-dependent methyltransferase
MTFRSQADMRSRNLKRPWIFRYDEPRYYRFGLALGIANISRNGFRLGGKKTLGKILQPINSYTRFPEYYYIGRRIDQYVRQFGSEKRLKILDVGSPKCLGLYLAHRLNVEVHLTDIYEPAVEESRILWNAIRDRARGKAVFSVQDGRASSYSGEYFDLVYSMSVIEHVEGTSGDTQGVREMVRVLKPGGCLLVTVPLGLKYIEQDRVGVKGAAEGTASQDHYFFQRIYAPEDIASRIFSAALPIELQETISIQRRLGMPLNVYRNLGTNLRAIFGFLNPLFSAVLNSSQEGIFPGASEYGKTHSGKDIYGDLYLLWQKAIPPAQD